MVFSPACNLGKDGVLLIRFCGTIKVSNVFLVMLLFIRAILNGQADLGNTNSQRAGANAIIFSGIFIDSTWLFQVA